MVAPIPSLFATSRVPPGIDDQQPLGLVAPGRVALPERRSEERPALALHLPVALLARPEAPEIKVHIHNLSTRGMRFSSRRPFRPGELLAFRMPTARTQEKLFLCDVIYCQPNLDDTYVVGAEFIEVILLPPESPVPPRWLKLARQI